MSQNRLRIRANALNLDLVGETEYIVRAYDAIQSLLIERFRESIEDVLDDEPPGFAEPPKPRDPLAQTIPMHKAVDPKKLPTADDPGPQHVNVVVCNEVYNKIYLVDRDQLEAVPITRVLNLAVVDRVYINRSQRDRFFELVKPGKVLWRELTSAGRAVVKGA